VKKTLRERIIRRLGGTPVYAVGRDPVPGYELIPVRTEICQKPEGVRITVEYIAEPEGQKRRRKA
jgi:hypothetical protein